MDVKGTAFVARRAQIERAFGPARFEELVRAQAAIDTLFHRPVLATSRLPIAPFLRLNDRIVETLYGGDPRSYWEVGEQSADFALGEGGPYRAWVEDQDVRAFAESASKLWATYFDEGSASSRLQGTDLVTLQISSPVQHPYFEYAVCGYFARGLALVSRRGVNGHCLRGFSRGDHDVAYEFVLR